MIAIDLVKLIGAREEGATGQVDQSVSPCTTKIYRVLMRDIFQDIIFILDSGKKLRAGDGNEKKSP